VHKCPTWTQGPAFVQQLALLEGYDLAAMGHNSPEYLHVLIECTKLAFADREAYYGDPRFDDVPMDVLLSSAYNEQRRGLIGDMASREMRPGAVDPDAGIPEYAFDFDVRIANQRALQMLGQDTGGEPTWRGSHSHTSDTTHLDAVDAAGNMVAATPSGGWIGSSPVIRGLGFPAGTRGQMFYLDPNRPNALAGHKRPRATLTPSLVLRDGQPYMVFGTPGGDCQDQWTLQFFLNYVDFGMTLQEALDAPTVHSEHFPSSFYPRLGYPARVVVEDRIPEEVLEALRQRGHDIQLTGGWSNGKTMAIRYDGERGTIFGGAAPKGIIGYALGW
jgi:gamma-glutamyltranspeptidase / glutathione hydrolase